MGESGDDFSSSGSGDSYFTEALSPSSPDPSSATAEPPTTRGSTVHAIRSILLVISSIIAMVLLVVAIAIIAASVATSM